MNHSDLTSTQPGVSVCYLARSADGIDPVRRFVDSYHANPAGGEHQLVILFKGFADESAKAPWREVLSSLNYSELDFEDIGFDLTPFKLTAHRLETDYFLFLNTWGYFLAPGWLTLMSQHITKPGVGVVASSVSCESHYSASIANLSGGYPWPFGRRSRMRRYLRVNFDPFPNYHFRTTGFLISKEVMRKMKIFPLHTKWDAYKLESGRVGFSRQIQNMGLGIFVTGRDGVLYNKDNAWKSQTFRSAEQGNLLIGDKQTLLYQVASLDEKAHLIRLAWGEVRPVSPT